MLDSPALVAKPLIPSVRTRAVGLVRTARPRQWVKNLLVVAAAGAAGALGRQDVPLRTGLTFLAFCLLASGIYAINDVRDAEDDRRHPTKRFRPVAAGQLPARDAVIAGLGSVLLGLLLAFAVDPLLGWTAIGYVALTLSYTLVWRHLVVFDIVAVAGGFVLRAIAGGVAAQVPLSLWFTLVVAFAALLVATGKRLAELMRTEADDAHRRRVLRIYTDSVLRMVMLASLVGVLVVYLLWALQDSGRSGMPWRLLTVIPFSFALTRYVMVARVGAGESPEELIFHDQLLRLAGVAWLALFVLDVNATT